MARTLSQEHKNKISKAMKARHLETKGIQNAAFGPAVGETDTLGVRPISSISESLSPADAYTLNVDLRAAVSAIANNLSKMRIRLFSRRSGDEIVAGKAYDLFRRPSPRLSSNRFINTLSSYYSLYNEFALLKVYASPTNLVGLMPLDPCRLFINEPIPVANINHIKQWRYSWEDGVQALYDSSLIAFDVGFNPRSAVRGASPVITGSNELSSTYQALRYNKSFFDNNAVPSHLLVLPEGVPAKERKEFEQRYLREFAGYTNNAHKVMTVSGGDIKMHPLETRPKDAEFTSLINTNAQRIATLYKVPAVEMGLFDKTRFETAQVERELFFENTLMPQAQHISDFLQDQIVNTDLSTGDISTRSAKLTKNFREIYENAMDTTESDIVVLLDPDTAPIFAKIQLEKIKAVGNLRREVGLSFNEAAEYMGIELPERVDTVESHRDMVFIPSNEVRIDNTGAEAPLAAVEVETDPAPAEAQKGFTDTQKALMKTLEKDIRALRGYILEKAAAGELFSLKEADNFNSQKNATLHNTIRLDHQATRELLNTVEPKEVEKQLKQHLNLKNKNWIRTIVLENNQ